MSQSEFATAKSKAIAFIIVFIITITAADDKKTGLYKEEELHKIMQINLDDKEKTYLGYKTTESYIHFFWHLELGMWISNDGYVLIPRVVFLNLINMIN